MRLILPVQNLHLAAKFTDGGALHVHDASIHTRTESHRWNGGDRKRPYHSKKAQRSCSQAQHAVHTCQPGNQRLSAYWTRVDSLCFASHSHTLKKSKAGLQWCPTICKEALRTWHGAPRDARVLQQNALLSRAV